MQPVRSAADAARRRVLGVLVGAAIVLAGLLRPDPLLRARALLATAPADAHASDDGNAPAGGRWSRPVLAAAAVMVATQLVHDRDHDDDAGAHHRARSRRRGRRADHRRHVATMYLPAPLSVWLVDRYGSGPAAFLAATVLLAAGVVAASTPDAGLIALALALALLGFGWNLGPLSGTTALTAALTPTERARTQGGVDVVVATSYPTLSLVGGALAALVLPLAALITRRRSTAPTSLAGGA